AHRVTKHTYHTTGKLDLNNIRNNIPKYQTATVVIDEAIDLPSPGIYPIKIRVDQKWHVGIAVLNKSYDSNKSYSRTIKFFIQDKLELPEKSDISMTWYFNIEHE